MKVLFDALQAGNRSGTGRYTVELAKRLPGCSPDVEVVVLWPDDQPPPVPGDDFPHVLASARSLRRITLEQVGMGRLSRALGADWVHFPANFGHVRAALPAVVTVHDLSFYRDPGWFRADRALYYRTAAALTLPVARRLMADSRATADDLIRFLKIPAAKIDVVPLGVDQRFRPATPGQQTAVREQYNLPESFALFVGTLEPRKNVARIVHAWSSVADQCGLGLVIAGRDGWKTVPVRRAIAESPYRDRIIRLEYVDDADLPLLISAATVFAWPTLWEGFGLPALEALACGVPVLTSSTSSLPEVVGDAALMVDPENTEAIAQGLLRLARDEKLRDDLRVRGPARAAGFTWERAVDLVLSVYRSF